MCEMISQRRFIFLSVDLRYFWTC